MTRSHDIPVTGLTEWSSQCLALLHLGASLLSLHGRIQENGTVLCTAIVVQSSGDFKILRAQGALREAYPSLTAHFPAAQVHERELWEQTSLVPAGHPWLKPVRYEGSRQQGMGNHPFFSVRGHDIHEVGVGPVHASVIEPGHFRFMCHGEQVHHLEIQLGYQHRALESLILKRPVFTLTSLLETVAGDSSIAYAWGHCAALEALAGHSPDLHIERLRGIALEMERIAMHLVALTGLATDIAFLQGGATLGRLRTAIINATMRVCGSRFGRGWLRPGGLRAGFDETLRQDWLKTLQAFRQDFDEVCELMLNARSVQSRLRGIGTVPAVMAGDIGLVGLAARASGLKQDWRVSHPGMLHTRHPLPMSTGGVGDCWARFKIRIAEISVSLNWIVRLLEDAGTDLYVPALKPMPRTHTSLQADTLVVSVREGFRGPVVQTLETAGNGSLVHYKLQDPSSLNWFGLAMSLRDNAISDFPICNKSFDLSYCGNDL